MAEPYLRQLSSKIANLELPLDAGIELECKHFFAGAALYANGQICASLTPAGFGLKLPAMVRDQLLAEEGGQELRYFEKGPVKRAYVALSPSIVDDGERLKTLLRLSIEYVVSGGSAT